MRFFTLFAFFLCLGEAIKLEGDVSGVREMLRKKNTLIQDEDKERARKAANPDLEEEERMAKHRLEEILDMREVSGDGDRDEHDYVVATISGDNLHLDHDFDGQLPSPDIGDGLYLDFDWEHATPEQKAANAAKRKAGAEKEFTNLNKGLNKPHATGTWWNYQADGGFKGNSKNGQRDDLTPVPLGHNAGHAFDHTRLHAHHRRTPKWLAEYRKKFPEDNQKTGLRYSDATYLNRRAEGDKIKMVSLDKAEDKDKKSEKKKKAD